MGTQDKMKTHVKQSNREKELSEIREMIAKTYKVVETGAERDDGAYKAKLFWFFVWFCICISGSFIGL